ncbi:hypothetical protein POKO110462_11490 [Pontibacter korlensis]|uniref:Uncharacterized protein n=1 Tax=Pontibacter korlensis TaxID=400092 RepID=A0A0E3ZGI7_9BACT|nr:hypothetical protein [Pontibacter korlensis]AKD04190.1 hypothetical protein PKOR_15205 [Pontibacter korlensis]
MTKQAQYTSIASAAFNEYLDNQIDLPVLISRLREIELQVMHDDDEEEETDKVLWFRFFEGDPLETSISDIEKDLSDPVHPNSRILLQGIALGLEAGELQVHYS